MLGAGVTHITFEDVERVLEALRTRGRYTQRTSNQPRALEAIAHMHANKKERAQAGTHRRT